MQETNSIFFKPWVGKSYQQGINGKKVLILSESHICGYNKCKGRICGDLKITEQKCREFTTNAVEMYFSYKRNQKSFEYWMNTYTRFSNIVHNKQLALDELDVFWDSILFYTYVQYSTEDSRISPTTNEFANSEQAFFEILDMHTPDLIIAWGKRLWGYLPANGEYENLQTSTKLNDGKGFYYYDTTNGKKIPIIYVYHPSTSRFNYSAYELIEEAINRA